MSSWSCSPHFAVGAASKNPFAFASQGKRLDVPARANGARRVTCRARPANVTKNVGPARIGSGPDALPKQPNSAVCVAARRFVSSVNAAAAGRASKADAMSPVRRKRSPSVGVASLQIRTRKVVMGTSVLSSPATPAFNFVSGVFGYVLGHGPRLTAMSDKARPERSSPVGPVRVVVVRRFAVAGVDCFAPVEQPATSRAALTTHARNSDFS